MRPLPLFCSLLLLFFAGCAGPRFYRYRYIPGRTATLENGLATAPAQAPARVRAAIEAGNRIARLPYAMGGGHGEQQGGLATAYDCSGATSYVLREAGLLRGSMPSRGFRRYGEPGEGDWITVYARRGHVFLVVAGLRYDTGWKPGPEGPGWTTRTRPLRGYRARHPSGW